MVNILSAENEESILMKCQHMCTICQNTNVQVHHIDGNHENGCLENLTVLCPTHHSIAQSDLQVKATMTRKLTTGVLKKYRDNWIEKCESIPNIWISEKESFKKEIITDILGKLKEQGVIP